MPRPDANAQIEAFLSGSPHAVAAASRRRNKYGNMVLRTYLENSRPVYVVNPNEESVEGLKSYKTLLDLPEPIHGVSIITPARVTEQIIEHAASLNIKHLWLQPGAESPAALKRAHDLGMNIIAEGPCILVVLGLPD